MPPETGQLTVDGRPMPCLVWGTGTDWKALIETDGFVVTVQCSGLQRDYVELASTTDVAACLGVQNTGN